MLVNRIVILLKLIFIVSLPLFLLAANLRLAINTPALYEYGFKKYDVSNASGIPQSDLHRIAAGLVGYFNSDDDLFQLEINRYGQKTQLFHENEAVHFRDVKGLVDMDFAFQWATMAYLLLFAIAMVAWKRAEGWGEVLSALRWGGGLTLGLLALLGLTVVVAFDQLFLAFHLAFFNNDLWLALSGDVMTVLFPEEFFRDALVMIAVAMAAESALIFALSWRAVRKGRASRSYRS